MSLSLAAVFVWQAENFGFAFLKLVETSVNRFSPSSNHHRDEADELDYPFGVRLSVGLLAYGMALFVLGLANLLYPNLVLGLSAGISILIWLGFGRFRGLGQLGVKIKSNAWPIAGSVLTFILLTPSFFRPPTLFDGVWYHLTIPKFFLEHHNIQYLGEALRYSVHPYLNFFWYLWPESLPAAPVWQYLAVNFINVLVVLCCVYYATSVFAKHLKWNKWWQLAAASLLSVNALGVEYYGSAYNDILAFGLSFVAIGFLFELSTRKTMKPKDFAVGVLLLLSIALLKAFFLIFAGVLGLYLLYLGLTRLPGAIKTKLTGLVGIGAVLGAIFVLPWLVRSYLATKNLLDPLGNPSLTQDLYDFAGSKNPFTHWTSFVWNRFFQQISSLLSIRYSPLVFVGLLAIGFESLRKKLGDIWVLGVLSFSVVYFVSIVSELRYFLPAIGILMILGLAVTVELFERSPNTFRRIAVALLVPVCLATSYAQAGPDFFNNMYVFSGKTKEQYLRSKAEYNAFAYYSLKDSPLPPDLGPKEKVFAVRILHMAYINRPVLEPTTDFKLFTDVKTAAQLKRLLKDQGIRYIVVKYWDMAQACREYLKLEDSQNCNDPQNFSPVLTDPLQSVNWFKVQD